MTQRQRTRRLRARLDDERGFTLVEVMVAITLIFASLATLAFTAAAGFKYVASARDQQSANQIASQIMEEIRGLAYSKIQQGLALTSVTADPNIVTGCAADPASTYRFQSCTGDKITWTNGLANVTPLVPNTGTCPGSGTPLCPAGAYPATYTWRTYVTNNNTATSPYSVTVLVTWVNKALKGRIQTIKLTSSFWSPAGCVSNSTHPFAGPCAPFFYGQALLPAGTITVAKSPGTGITGTTFSTGKIQLVGGEADIQQEEIPQVQATLAGRGYSVTDTGPHTGGNTSVSTVASDGDPASSAPPFASQTLGPTAATSYPGSLSSPGFQFSIAAGDTGTAVSTTAAGGSGSPACPPAPGVAQTDLLPCGGMTAAAGGTAFVKADGGSSGLGVGAVNVVQLAAPASPSSVLANRDAIAGQDGVSQETVSRNFGRLDIGTVPAWITTNCPTVLPAGFTSFLSLQNYSDTVQATAGSTAAAPTATINSGTLSYWPNAAITSASTAVSVNIATTPNYSITSGWTSSVACTKSSGAANTRGTMTASLTFVGAVAMGSQPTTSSTPAGAGSILRNDTTATIGSPVYGQFEYKVVNAPQTGGGGGTPIDLFITLDLGTSSAHAVYQAAPTAG
jgi:prepilin-type N-terminal cleavage/methylation domain-containing protein